MSTQAVAAGLGTGNNSGFPLFVVGLDKGIYQYNYDGTSGSLIDQDYYNCDLLTQVCDDDTVYWITKSTQQIKYYKLASTTPPAIMGGATIPWTSAQKNCPLLLVSGKYLFYLGKNMNLWRAKKGSVENLDLKTSCNSGWYISGFCTDGKSIYYIKSTSSGSSVAYVIPDAFTDSPIMSPQVILGINPIEQTAIIHSNGYLYYRHGSDGLLHRWQVSSDLASTSKSINGTCKPYNNAFNAGAGYIIWCRDSTCQMMRTPVSGGVDKLCPGLLVSCQFDIVV
jgi:hypothetical protein